MLKNSLLVNLYYGMEFLYDVELGGILSGQAEVLGTWIKLIELLHYIDDYLGRMLYKIKYIH